MEGASRTGIFSMNLTQQNEAYLARDGLPLPSYAGPTRGMWTGSSAMRAR